MVKWQYGLVGNDWKMHATEIFLSKLSNWATRPSKRLNKITSRFKCAVHALPRTGLLLLSMASACEARNKEMKTSRAVAKWPFEASLRNTLKQIAAYIGLHGVESVRSRENFRRFLVQTSVIKWRWIILGLIAWHVVLPFMEPFFNQLVSTVCRFSLPTLSHNNLDSSEPFEQKQDPS